MQESIRYHILKQIQDNPEIIQRELARVAGVSLGKINYCLRGLVDKGLIKADRFRQNPHKGRYLYALTPKGLEEKTRVTSEPGRSNTTGQKAAGKWIFTPRIFPGRLV